MSFPRETSVKASASLRALWGPRRAIPRAGKSRILVSREMETLADIAAIIAQEKLRVRGVRTEGYPANTSSQRARSLHNRAELLVRGHAHRCATFLKSAFQVRGDLFGAFALDLVALHHVDKLSLFQDSD